MKMNDNSETTDRMLKGLKMISGMQGKLPELLSAILGILGHPLAPLHDKLNEKSQPDVKTDSIQFEAIKMAIQSRLSVIQGPPGSGKTVVSTIIVWNLIAMHNKQVLVCAPSNIAVANLAEKIGSTGLNVFTL